MAQSYQNPIKGVLLTLTGFSAFACGDAVFKHLSASYPIYTILFYDVLLAVALLLAAGPWLGGYKKTFSSPQKKWHFLRGGIALFQTAAGMYAFSQMTLAKTYALLFCSPFFTILLAVLLLKEKITPGQITALVMGFIGVLIVLRPGFIPLDAAALAALGSALGFSITNMIVKHIRAENQTLLAIGLYPNLIILAGSFAVLLANFEMPAAQDFLWIGILSVLSVIGFLTLSLGFIHAPAVIAAPLHYTQMLWAIFLGWLVFGDSLDPWIGLGAGIVILSGLLLIERKKTPLRTLSTAAF